MNAFRHLHVCFVLFLASVSARAQFTLDLSPVAPGTGALQFNGAPGYYYCLESSGNLLTGFAQTSGWIKGDGTALTWPIYYPASPSSGGSGGTAGGDTFSLYPFTNGKTLVTWNDLAGAAYTALIVEDYSFLPPLVNISGTATTDGLILLVGNLAWNPAYETLDPALLPAAQQTVLARLTSRHSDVLAATSGSATGTGLTTQDDKHFYRIRRMDADDDDDGLDWALETFILKTDPNKLDTDGDDYSDGAEVANGTDPTDAFDGSAPVITILSGDKQLGWTGQFDAEPLVVHVANAVELKIPNQPVVFSAPIAALALSNDPAAPLSTTITMMTDEEGEAAIYFRQPNTKNVTTMIHAQTQGKAPNTTRSVDFSALSVGGNIDGASAPVILPGEWLEGVNTEVDGYEVNWEDTSDNEETFVIERSVGTTLHWIPVGVVPANTTSYIDYYFYFDEPVSYRVVSVAP